MTENKALSLVLAIVICAAFLYLGYKKTLAPDFMDDTASVELFNQIEVVAIHYLGEQYGQYAEPSGRWAIGGLEILTGLLVIWPVTRMLGAILAFLITAGAVASHIAGEFVEGSEFGIAVTMHGQPTFVIFAAAMLLFVLSILLMMVGSGSSK